jgi:Lhr-like helicase
MNAGIIVMRPCSTSASGTASKLGTVEEYFASTLSPGDTFYFAGLVLEVERIEAPTSRSVPPPSRRAFPPMSVPAWR